MNRESESKRLVELLKAMNTAPEITCPRFNKQECKGCQFENGIECDIAGREADYLLNNGIVVPPVKVGQTVYYVCGIHNKLVEEAKIEEIYYNGESYMYLVNSNYLHFEMTPDELYFTREDAVKALKGEVQNG